MSLRANTTMRRKEDQKKQERSVTIIMVIVIIIILIIAIILIILLFRREPTTDDGDTTDCSSNRDCTGLTPFCNTTTSECQQCVNDSNCPGSLPVCTSPNNVCVECTANTHCNSPLRPLCNVSSKICAECILDTDCLGEDLCIVGVCNPCILLSPPTVTSATMSGFSTLSTTWSVVPGATSYIVRYDDTDTNGDFSQWTTTGTSLISSAPNNGGGDPCLICAPGRVRVRAVDSCGAGAFSIGFSVPNPTCC